MQSYRADLFGAVSYTHLDVYKRQAAAHLNRVLLLTVSRGWKRKALNSWPR